MKSHMQIVCLLMMACLLPAAAPADSGTANTFGYNWSDKLDYNWIDTSSGTTVLLSDDSMAGPFPLGFSFYYYGDEKTTFSISSNGNVGLGDTTSLSSLSNQCPLSTSSPNDIVMVYWDDLNPGSAGTVRYMAGGTEPYRYMVIEWNGVPHYSSSDPLVMQAVLLETADWIYINYQDASSEQGSGGTIGIKNSDGTDNLNIGCDTPGIVADNQSFWIGLESPHDLTAGAGTGSIHLDWTDEFADEDGTVIERADFEAGPYTQIDEVDTGITEYDDTDAGECSDYWYRVASQFNDEYYSPYSNNANYTFPPFAPTDLTVTGISYERVELNWTDNSECETEYIVERAEADEMTWVQIATLDADSEFYADEDFTPGEQYLYRVLASNPPLVSGPSNEAGTVTFLETPGNPAATAFSESKIDLTWEDNSEGEDGYTIERYDPETESFIEINAVGADATSYRDFDLERDTEYTYRVRAYSILTYSEYSAEVSATTWPDETGPGDDDDDDDDNDNDADDDDETPQDGGDDDDDDDEGCCG